MDQLRSLLQYWHHVRARDSDYVTAATVHINQGPQIVYFATSFNSCHALENNSNPFIYIDKFFNHLMFTCNHNVRLHMKKKGYESQVPAAALHPLDCTTIVVLVLWTIHSKQAILYLCCLMPELLFCAN